MTWGSRADWQTRRQPDYSDAAIQTCLTMKVLFGIALRQTTGFAKSLLQLIDLDWAVPHFSTLSRRQKGLKVNIPTAHRRARCTCRLTAQASRSRSSGVPTSTATRNAVSGTRSISTARQANGTFAESGN